MDDTQVAVSEQLVDLIEQAGLCPVAELWLPAGDRTCTPTAKSTTFLHFAMQAVTGRQGLSYTSR